MNTNLKIGGSALISAILYGVVNNTLETKLSSYSFIATAWLIHLTCTVVGGLVLVSMKLSGKEISFPVDSSGGKYILLTAGLYYLASIMDVYAYSIGGSAFVISTIFIAIPLTVLVLMATSERGLPGIGQLGPFLLVVIALIWAMTDAMANKQTGIE